MNQKTIVERMKPLYPGLTQPIYSAVVRKRAGIQWTTAFLRDAEEKGVEVKHDKDGRYFSIPYKCRLTEKESVEFDRYLQGTGQTAQETIRQLILGLIGRAYE